MLRSRDAAVTMGRTPSLRTHGGRYDRIVKKALAVVLIIGFLLVDFLFFHDILKAGEVVTFPQYLTGLLSIPVIVGCVWFLLRGNDAPEHAH
jgi:hypothetical protein